MSEDKMDVQNYNESLIYDYTTSRYYQVIYDPYHEIYYRFALMGNTIDELNDPEINYKLRARVILLDKKFKKVGEVPLERGRYLYQNFFVGKNGLHLQIDPALYENEDDLIFDVFEPVKYIGG